MDYDDDLYLTPYSIGLIILYCVMWGAVIYFRI